MHKTFFTLLLLSAAALCRAQLAGLPLNAQAVLYFPHLADGGPASSQWQTRFTFINPNASSASVTLSLYADSGSPLALNFGSGLVTYVAFSVAPNGTYVLQSKMAGSTLSTGWAYATATLPVQANVAFRSYANGKPLLEITAEPTLPSLGYRSVATPLVGVAIANQYNNASLPATVTVYDGSGNSLGQKNVTIPALGHKAFNLNSLFTNLPASFTGNLLITCQNPGWDLIAWAVYADSSGVISSLPDGRASFPVSPREQIITAFTRLVNAYQTSLPDFGDTPALDLGTNTDSNAINAFASGGTTVTFNLALGELIGDSPSEIAFVAGHELGHIYQQRTGKMEFYTDVEWDADAWGLWMAMVAGYDPYAAAGTLGKLGMATGTMNLGVQQWEDSQLAADAHGSFSTRIDNLTNMIESVCSSSTDNQNACTQYKSAVHPYFPPLSSVPLARPSPSLVK
jgi:hypothetical protein